MEFLIDGLEFTFPIISGLIPEKMSIIALLLACNALSRTPERFVEEPC